MTYKLKDGRVSAYYGDTNVVLELDGFSTGTEVQFRKNAEDTWNVTIENGEVTIPNEFFNGSYSMIIFYVTDGANTIGKGSIDIIPRTFPSDYSYEPTKIRTYEDILAEMKGMRDESKSSADSAGESASSASSSANNAEASATKASSTLTAVENIKNNVASMESDVESMASQVSADKTDVSNIRTEMNSVKEAVETSEKSVTASEENVKNMKSSVSSMKTSVESTASQVTADKEQVLTWVDSISGTATALSGFAETEVSFPKSDDKILILRGNEGKYITTENLTNYVKTHDGDASLAAIIDQINANTFKDNYANGDAIMSTFTNGSTVYEYPLIVVDNNRDVILADGTTAEHRAILQPLYCPHFGVQLSQYRAFLACPEGLAAGTYSITFAQAWSKLTSDILTWSFTLTKAVPSGGRIAGFRNFADGQSDKNIRVYQNDGKTLVETVTASQGAADGATDLGTLGYTTRSGNLSSMQETFYGSNDPDVSAIMQWLNSDADVGMWWVPKDQWDVAPDALASYKGYLAYLDPEHVKVMKTVQVKTLYNTVQGHAAADYRTDYCRAYPPSLEEMYIQPYNTAGVEGEYLPYYKELLGTDSPVAKYTTYPELITYDVVNKGAQLIWLRSGVRSFAHNQFHCYSSGRVGYYYAYHARRVRPLEVW